MGQRLRRVVEGHLPAMAGVSEEGAAAEAEVLTEAEWTDLARVSCAHKKVVRSESCSPNSSGNDKEQCRDFPRGEGKHACLTKCHARLLMSLFVDELAVLVQRFRYSSRAI